MHQPQQQVQIGFAADWSPSLTICGNATDPASFGVSVISIVGSINRKPEESWQLNRAHTVCLLSIARDRKSAGTTPFARIPIPFGPLDDRRTAHCDERCDREETDCHFESCLCLEIVLIINSLIGAYCCSTDPHRLYITLDSMSTQIDPRLSAMIFIIFKKLYRELFKFTIR